MNKKITLIKFLVSRGIESRRKIEVLIKKGLVTVNNQVVSKPNALVDVVKDYVQIKGYQLPAKEKKYEYYLLNKPENYVSATIPDSTGLPSVVSLINTKERLVPVGRLDIKSEGLLILTNDGDMTYKLTHPKFHIKKTYQIMVKGKVSQKKIEKLETGILINDKLTARCRVKPILKNHNESWLEFELSEGRNRQIRKMCASVDLHVYRLVRTQIAFLEIKKLRSGEYRKISQPEIIRLKALIK